MPAGFPLLRTWIQESKQRTAPLWIVAILRIYLGVAFLSAASNKIFGWWASWLENMSHFLTSKLSATYGFYRPFLVGMILPHAAVFARTVALTEVAVGLALLLGAATRVAAALGLVLITNYMLALGDIPWQPGEDQAFFVGLLVVLLTNAGKAFGVDQLFGRRVDSIS